MIIDSHAHVSRADWSSPKFLEEVIEPAVRASGEPISPVVYEGTDIPGMMEMYRAAGVDKVFLYAVAPREPKTFGRDPATREISGAHVSNDFIADVCSQYPDQTLPVMSVNPRYEGDTVLGEMERCVRELGARAVKLYPTYNHYRPDDRELCWPIYAKAMELGIPVIVHQSWTTLVDAAMKYQYPAQLDDVARDFRDLVLICCHFGVPWIEEAMCLVGKQHERLRRRELLGDDRGARDHPQASPALPALRLHVRPHPLGHRLPGDASGPEPRALP